MIVIMMLLRIQCFMMSMGGSHGGYKLMMATMKFYTHFEARAWHNLIFFFRSPMVACVIIFIRGAAAVIHILQCGRT